MQNTIKITLDANGTPVPLSGDGQRIEINRVVKCHDEIRWISDHGTVEVDFQNGTPFAGKVHNGNAEFRTIAADKGTFHYKCTITTPDGKKHGWNARPQNAEGGGTVEVGAASRTGTA